MYKIVTCDDCKTDKMEMYMLRDALWHAVAKKKEHLCIKCFEKRLGRRITLYDLKPCSISNSMLLGAYITRNTPCIPNDEFLLDPESYANRQKAEYDFIKI